MLRHSPGEPNQLGLTGHLVKLIIHASFILFLNSYGPNFVVHNHLLVGHFGAMGRSNLLGGQNNLLGGQLPTQLTCYSKIWLDFFRSCLKSEWLFMPIRCKH